MHTKLETALHNLNNKLGIILGNSELLLDINLPGDILRHIHQINHSVLQACEIVRSLQLPPHSTPDMVHDTTPYPTDTTSAP